MRLHVLEGDGSLLEVLLNNSRRAFKNFNLRISGGIGINNLDSSISTCVDILGFSLNLENNLFIFKCLPLLLGPFGVDDCMLISVWQVDLKEHESSNMSVSRI